MRIETTSLASFSQKGSMLATGTKSKILDASFSPGSKLQIVDLDTEQVIFRKEVHSRFNRLEWGQYEDRLFLAGGLDGGNTTLWDATALLEEKQEPKEICFTNHTKTDDDILGMDFAIHMPILATGSSAGKILLWNLRTLDRPLAPGNTTKYDGISCLQWNKKIPQVLAVGTLDGTVSVLDLRGKSEVSRLAGPYFSRSEITSMQWNPSENTQIAVSSSSSECKDVMIYDLRVTRGSPRLEGHTDGILKCNWSTHDPSLIVTCGCDGEIIAWNAKTFQKRGVMVNETAFDFQFSPEHPDTISYSTFNGEVVVDTLTSLNAKSSFLDAVPQWHKQGPALCFTPNGLLVYKNKVHLKKWKPQENEDSQELKIISAYASDTPRKEILKLFNASVENSPIEENEEEEQHSVEIDQDDPITNSIIHGNLSEAFKSALEKDAALAALVALADGIDVLKREKKRILKAPGASSSLLLLISVLTGAYNDLIQQNVEWSVLVKILGRHCEDDEFVPKVHQIAKSLEEKDTKGAMLCYLIAKDLQKYQSLEEQRMKEPKTLHEAYEFDKEFEKVFSVVEKGAKVLKQKVQAGEPTIRYLKHLLDQGEKPRVTEFLGLLTEEAAETVRKELGIQTETEAAEALRKMNIRPSMHPPARERSEYPPPFANSSFMPRPNMQASRPMATPPKPGTFSTSSPFASTGTISAATPNTPKSTAPKISFVKTQPPSMPFSSGVSGSSSYPSTPGLQNPGQMQPPAYGLSTPSNAMDRPRPPMPSMQPPAQHPSGQMQHPSGQMQRPSGQMPPPLAPHPMQGSAYMQQQSSQYTPYSQPQQPQQPHHAMQGAFNSYPRPTPTPEQVKMPPPMAPRPPTQTPSAQMQPNLAPQHAQGHPRPNVDAIFGAKTPQMAGRSTQGMGYPPGNSPYPHHQTPTAYAHNPPFPPQQGYRGPVAPREITPEEEAVYARFEKVVETLTYLVKNKEGSLKTWLLKTIQPKVEVLKHHLKEKDWPVEFIHKMDEFLKRIEDLGIFGKTSHTVSAGALDEIRKAGDDIMASRPIGTEVEKWMSAIYSLLKVALH
ncbi:protein transport protein SEC31 [Nematocida sp. LUAm3]|nr:protein transport protein SEC31 [Nematocida sp. LUAm3]KAI5175687.1 protein transport protein SEC31 [Nematocida sp. LUAm2]KAI5178593.1 protein transport protein SEC31 [Nematocida sp. LUAm1]